MGGKTIEAFLVSKLVIGQVMGELEARDARMQEYLGQVKRLQSDFESFNLAHVSRSGNTYADSLATLATSSAQHLPQMIFVEDLCKASSVERDTFRIHQIRRNPSWMDPIMNFLKDDTLPEGKPKAEKIRRNAPRFWLSGDHKLYKRSYSGPYLLYIHPEESESLLEELHEGIYGSHTGGGSLAHRALTQGYWWPNMQREAQEYAKKCDQCQRFAPNIHQSGGVLNPLSSSWSFA